MSKCCNKKTVYIAGPYYNNAEKNEQTRLATTLERAGFKTYLPQRDGLPLQKVITTLINEGKTQQQAIEESPQIIFDYNIYNLMKSQCLLVDANHSVINEDTVATMSIAFSSCISIVLYRNDLRTFALNYELSPMINAMKSVPIVRKINDIVPGINKALPKRDCKCISDSIKEVMRRGSTIKKVRFR